ATAAKAPRRTSTRGSPTSWPSAAPSSPTRTWSSACATAGRWPRATVPPSTAAARPGTSTIPRTPWTPSRPEARRPAPPRDPPALDDEHPLAACIVAGASGQDMVDPLHALFHREAQQGTGHPLPLGGRGRSALRHGFQRAQLLADAPEEAALGRWQPGLQVIK